MKKLVSILTTLVLALQLTTAYAGVTTGTPALTVTVGELNEETKEFTVTVAMTGVKYWTDVTFEVDYDSEAMGLKKAASTSAVQGLDVWGDPEISLNITKSATKSVDPQYFNYYSATQACTYNGTMASMTFKLTDAAVPGKTYPITVQPTKGPDGTFVDGVNTNYFINKQIDDEIVDVPFDKETRHAFGFNYVSGSITIPGDPEPEGPTMNATKTGTTVSITATPDGDAFTGKFIVAGYDADGLAQVVIVPAAATATAEITADCDTVKVMWWDSLTDLNSVVPADTDMAN